MAWLSGWSHRKKVTITGQSGAGTGYQVKLSIGDSAGGDFHLEGNCTNFPQDITVTDNDGITLLDYWVEDLTTDPITVWVEVADDLGSNVDVYIYYGKSGESSATNITNAFPSFSDDFPGSSIDTGKWEGDTAYASVLNSILTYYSVGIHEINTITNFDDPTITRAKIKFPQIDSYVGDFGFVDSAAVRYVDLVIKIGYNKMRVYNGTWSTQDTNIIPNEYHIYEIEWESSSTAFYKDDVEMTGSPLTSNIPTISLPLFIYSQNTVYMYLDWVLIRKYNALEPAFSSVGSEENPPSAYTYGSRGAYSILF